MEVKSYYEKYWSHKRKYEGYWDYERNWVLPYLFTKKERILDLGCGDGIVAEFLQNDLKMEVVGFDVSEKAVNEAKKRGIKVVIGDVEKKLPFKDSEFDSVFWGDNVEHLFDPQFTLKEINRILVKNGRVILSCPNLGYWRYRIHFFLNGSLPDTEWTGNPPWIWSHIRFFNKKIMSDFLKSKGFIVERFIGINKLFPDKYLLSLSPSIFGMIMVVEARKNG